MAEEKTEEPSPVNTEAGEPAPVEEPAEGEQPEAEEPAPETTDETPIGTLSELAEHFELDPVYVKTLKVPVTVDGTPTEATIDDLVKSYQITSAAENRLEDAKNVAKMQSEAWVAKHQQIDTQFHVLADMLKQEEAKLERDVKAVDPRLRDDDPAEWAARVQEFNQRRAEIAQSKANAEQNYHAFLQHTQQQNEAVKLQYQDSEKAVLRQKLPELADPEKGPVLAARIGQYLMNYGYAPKEIEDAVDHRHFVIAHKAMLYDESRGQVETAKKRVATVPKIMKPGAPKAREQIASERLASLKAQMEKTGSEKDAYAYRMAKRGAR